MSLGNQMRCVLKLLALVAVVGSCAVGTAAAQPSSGHNQLKDPRSETRIRFGPVFLKPGFSLSRLGYDSRVADSEGDTRSDFVVSFAPNVVVWMPVTRRALLTTTLTYGVTYFSTHKNQSSTDPGYDVKAEFSLFRMVPFLERSVQTAWRQPSDEVDIRVPLTTRSTSAGIAFSPMGRTSLLLSAYRSSQIHESTARYLGVDLSRELNDVQQGVSVRIDRRVTSLTKLHASLENRQDRFEKSPTRNMAGVRFLVGSDFGKKAFVLGQAEVGFQHMRMEDGRLPNFSGIVGAVTLQRSLGAATVISTDWTRDIASSFQTVRPYFTSRSFKLRLRQGLGRSIDILIGPDFGRATYVRAANDSRSLVVKNTGFDADFGYRVTRQSRVGLVLTRVSRTSEVPDVRSFSGLRIGVSFSRNF